MKVEKLKGKHGFETYYSNLFGDRWKILKQSLLNDVSHFEFKEGLIKPYYLDKASFFVASQFKNCTGENCLDMCAAPGGKTLRLATILDSKIKFFANEISGSRRARLVSVLNEHLISSNRNRIEVLGYDGAKMAKFNREQYDLILLDAPCSSERHVMKNEKFLDEWSESRIKNLAIRQWSLLSSAFLLLKKGGVLVYSTCALSPIENDGIIQKLLKKYKYEVKIITPAPFENAEKTEYGLIFLPDKSGYGPMFFSKIEKV